MFGILALIGTALAGVMSAVSSYQQGKNAERMAEYNAAVAENQAQWDEYYAAQQAQSARQQAEWAEYNAYLAEQEAAVNKSKKERETERLISAQRARYGKSGVQLTGSPLEVIAETAIEGEYDALTLEYEGDVEAWNWRKKALTYESEATAAEIEGASSASLNRARAGMNMLKGREAGRAGTTAAFSTILTTGGQMAGMYGSLPSSGSSYTLKPTPTWRNP